MKLRCFTSLIIAVVMVSAVGAVEVYNKNGNTLSIFGNIVGGQCFSKNYLNDGSHSFMRYGLISKTYISDEIFGFGKWEHEFCLQNVETGMNLRNYGRSTLGYVGIKFGDFGSIDYGRNYGVLHDVIGWADLISDFGEDLLISDNFLSGRASNVITYRNNNFFGFLNGFDFAVQYQCKNDVNQSTGRTVKTANGDGYGVSASYSLKNGIAASVAYVNSKRTVEQKSLGNVASNINNDIAEAYSVGLKYDAHGVYFAAIYGETYNMTPFGNFNDSLNPDNIYGFINNIKNVEVTARYKFNSGFIPLISYLQSKSDSANSEHNFYLKKCITVGTGYAFNKNIFAVLDYRVNFLNKKTDVTTTASDSTTTTTTTTAAATTITSTVARICSDSAFAIGISYLF